MLVCVLLWTDKIAPERGTPHRPRRHNKAVATKACANNMSRSGRALTNTQNREWLRNIRNVGGQAIRAISEHSIKNAESTH